MRKWRFKKTLSGHVLTVLESIPSDSPGNFYERWNKASEDDIRNFEHELKESFEIKNIMTI